MAELSIIGPTFGQLKQIDALLESIINSDITAFYEAIVVDQNRPEVLKPTLCKYSFVKHKNVSFKGWSRAKSYSFGLPADKLVCFLDDDCMVLKKRGLYTAEVRVYTFANRPKCEYYKVELLGLFTGYKMADFKSDVKQK